MLLPQFDENPLWVKRARCCGGLTLWVDECSHRHYAQKQQRPLMFSHNQQQNYTVYASGFTPFEKSTIASFLRISAARPPGWRLVNDLTGAAVVLLSVTSREEIDAFIPRLAEWQKVLVVGSSSFGTRWPTVPRPIRLAEVLATLTDLTRDRPDWSAAPSSQAPLDSASPVDSSNPVSNVRQFVRGGGAANARNASSANSPAGLEEALAALRQRPAPADQQNWQRQTA